MKTLFFASLMLASASIFAQLDSSALKNPNAPEITFETNSHDFGTIPQNGNGTFEFVYRNTGKDPLILSDVKTSCGCTTPEPWSREPLLKGKKSSIKIKYDTNRIGNFSKSITVYSNAKNSPVILYIKGNVDPNLNKGPETTTPNVQH